MSELDVHLKMQASQEAFSRLYLHHGVEVSWAKHPPSTLTNRFIAKVLDRNPNPLVYDLGCGEGGKAFYIARYGIRVFAIDPLEAAIQIANHQVQELDLGDRVHFACRDLLEIKPDEVEKADGIHEYQCINHIARELYPRIVKLIAGLLPEEGVFLTNAFCKDTTNFYGEDISQRENGEFIFKFDPNNAHHLGKEDVDGMYCYFFSEQDLVALYSPYFRIEEMIKVPHPFIDGRFHWEVLMSRKIE